MSDNYAIEATDPSCERYVLRYTMARSEQSAWALLHSALNDRAALLHPLATLRVVKIPPEESP